MKRRMSLPELPFRILNPLILALFGITCFYPFYYILVYSVSSPMLARQRGLLLYPVGFTFGTFQKLFGQLDLLTPIAVSLSRAVVGTLVTIFCTGIFAYLLTQKKMILRRFVYRLVVITMYVQAGLIPWYLTMKMLALQDSFLLYVVPSAVVAFYLILFKTYIEQLPPSLEESAMMDGAGYLTVFFRIVLPLSTPIVATIALFSALSQWNSWTDNFFLVHNPRLQTIQLVLLTYLRGVESVGASGQMNAAEAATKASNVSPTAIRMAITVISVIPIAIVYPFMQRHFAKGILLGAVKG